MKVVAIKCESCEDTIYSRTHHDMRYCSCGSVAIDGGRDYTKISFKTKTPPKTFEIEIDATEKQLYDDWNKGENKLGKIAAK